jgi:hypothetical protein
MMPFAHLIAALLTCATPTSSATPDAETLLRRGNEAAKLQRWAEALAWWAEAEAFGPAWQPAFNQATVLAFEGRTFEAWQACQRALGRDIPADRKGPVERDCAEIEAALRKTHAELVLEVAPPDAEVRLEGEPWPEPRRTFTTRNESRLDLRRDGYLPKSLVWAHEAGKRSLKEVALAALSPAPAAPPAPAVPSGATQVAPVEPVEPVDGAGIGGVWKWIAWGAGAGAGAAGAVLLNDAAGRRSPRVFRSEADAAEAEFIKRRDPGIGLAIAGGTALAAGFILWWLEN